MSFASKGRDSKDVAKLRKEYEGFAQQVRTTKDAASAAALRDKKNAAFEAVKDQVVAERRDNLAGLHKLLIQQGKLKTREEMAAERKAAEVLSPGNKK